MGDPNTNGYDVAFVVSNKEMGRLVQTAFLERLPAQGLPLEFELPITYEIVDDSGATVSMTGYFAARFDLPIISFDPYRDTVNDQGDPDSEHPGKSMEIRLPFRESALGSDISRPGAAISDLSGDLSLIIPFGYPTDGNGDSFFGLDVPNLKVWLRLADDDPDENNLTTRDKLNLALTLMGQTLADCETEIATQLKSGSMMTEMVGTIFDLRSPACPTQDVAEGIPTRVKLEPPSDIRCIDFETFRSKGDPSLSFLALKLKLAQRTFMTAVDADQNALGRLSIGSRASVLISNNFLTEHMLPPPLMRGLITQEVERRTDENEEDIANEFFDAPRTASDPPLNIRSAVPLRLELFLADEDDDDPNTFIEDVSLTIVPDPEDNDDNNMVRVTLKLKGGAPRYAFPGAFAMYYSFDATVRINVRFSTARGQIHVETKVDDEPTVNVHLNSMVDRTLAEIAENLTNTLGDLGEQLAIQYILPIQIAVTLATVLANVFARGRIRTEEVNEQLPEASADMNALPVPLVLTGARFDDLVLKGNLAPAEATSLSYEGYTPLGSAGWRLNLERERLDLPQLMANDPLQRDAFNSVSVQDANVVCDGVTISPLNGTRLHDFGTIPVWLALNKRQADLRNADYDIAGPIDGGPGDGFWTERESDIELAQINPPAFRGSLGLHIHAFGVRTGLGRFALLVVWKVGSSQLRGFCRRYNQALPGVELVPLFNEVDAVNPTDHRGCSKVIDSLETVVVPTGMGGGSVSVQVGHSHYECVYQGEFEARAILLRRPLEFTWTVINRHGDRHTLAAGRPNRIDLESRSTSTTPLDSLSGSFVTFTLGGRNNGRCSFATQSGLSGSFTIEVQVVERGERTFTAERRVAFNGTRVSPTGYDSFSRWLDTLQKGIQDPSTWPELGLLVQDFGLDPTITAPNLLDLPVDEPGLGVPGVSDPPRPGRDSLSANLARRGLNRSNSRQALRLRREGARTQYDRNMSKDQLIKKTLRNFQDLPDKLRAQPKVERYMAKVMELVSSLPDPPALDDAGMGDDPKSGD